MRGLLTCKPEQNITHLVRVVILQLVSEAWALAVVPCLIHLQQFDIREPWHSQNGTTPLARVLPLSLPTYVVVLCIHSSLVTTRFLANSPYLAYLITLLIQSRNWDGGYQEYSTAEQCVRKVFPGSNIVANCVDKYPIKVIVTAELDDEQQKAEQTASGKKNIVVWSGSQRNLFRKYSTQRRQSIEEITKNLQQLEEQLEY